MPRSFSLAHLTALDLPPPELIAVAASAGYQRVGLRLLPVADGAPAWPLMDDAPLLRTTLARMAATGIAVADVEIVALREETDVAALRPFLEAGARLGAKHVLVAGYDPDATRLAGRFAVLCDGAAECGLTADLEFMPWTAVPDLASALRIVHAAARPNAGILVDALHFDRSGSTLAEVAAVPRALLHYWHLCDAPAGRPATTEELIHTARAERLFPGEGGLDLAALARALPPGLPVALEIPTATLARTVGAEERARRALAGAEAVLAAIA